MRRVPAITCGGWDQLHVAQTARPLARHFVFRDATDLEPATEKHQHDLWFDLSNPDRPVRGETYSSKDGPGAPERLHLVRDGEG